MGNLRSISVSLALTAAIAAATTAAADSIILSPAADATLYEIGDGSLCNGAGQNFFVGRSGNGLRRGLIRFDLSAIPAGSAVNSVRLQLAMNRTISGPGDIVARRVTADWLEGSVDASGQEGGGAGSAGSATWLHRDFNTVFWTSPGGDFAVSSSASTNVDGVGTYSWSGPGLAADVSAWLADPTVNFGWILIGDESVGITSAKRFASRTNPSTASRPILEVDFTPPPCGDLNADNVVDEADLGILLGAWRTGNQGDVTGDGMTDEADLGVLLSTWRQTCP